MGYRIYVSDEVGPTIRRDSAENYAPDAHYGIYREFSQLGRTLGPEYGTYRNHSFNSTIDKSSWIDDKRVGFPAIRDSFGYKELLIK